MPRRATRTVPVRSSRALSNKIPSSRRLSWHSRLWVRSLPKTGTDADDDLPEISQSFGIQPERLGIEGWLKDLEITGNTASLVGLRIAQWGCLELIFQD